MDEILDLATQGEDAGGGAASDGSGGAAVVDANEPFLKVNDRQVYRTREEAAKAFDEAGRRIATLSPYEKTLKEFYGDQYSPEVLRGHLAELVANRKEKTDREAAEAAKTAAGGANDPRFEGQTAEQIKQIKAADKWFEDTAKSKGYVSQADVKKLQERLDAIENGGKAQSESAHQNLVTHGQSELANQLKASNVQLSDAEMSKLEKRIVGYVNGDDDLVARWQEAVQTRNRADAAAIVMEAAKVFLPLVKPGAKFTDPVTAKIQAGAQRNQLQRQVPRQLPRQGAAAGAAPAAKTKYTGLGDKRLTERAFAMMDEMAAQD